MSYRAFVVDQQDGVFSAAVRQMEEAALPPGEVTIAVEWSDVNYKDGLASAADGRVVRGYPMVPGIDLAGTVIASTDGRYREGDAVLCTGYELGVSHPGGFAERARVPAGWLVRLPRGLSAEEAMALGTAGFTAGLSVQAIQDAGITPAAGPVLVTGATGGVGSTAVAMLAGLGYTVAASTGKGDQHDYLRALGASEVLAREEVSAESKRPLEAERWAAAVDPVGGATTAYLLRTTKRWGLIAVSGLAGGTAFATTVLPLILRGVTLRGIESVYWPPERRPALWERLASDLKPAGLLDRIVERRVGLEQVPEVTASILKGGIRGRVLVRP